MLFCFIARGKDFGVEVRLTTPPLVEVHPGKLVTATFLVSNHTPNDEDFIEELVLPPGWQKVAPTDIPFSIKGRAQQVRVIAALVPATTRSGRFEVKYVVRSRRDYALAESGLVSVAVLPLTKLELLVEDQPRTIIAGDEYTVRGRLMNRGNSTVAIRVLAKSSPELLLKPESINLTLEAGESQSFAFRVATDPNIKRKLNHVLTLKVLPATETNQAAALASYSLSVEIIPKITGEVDTYHRIPARLRVMAVQEEGKSAGFQTELSGAGSLTEDGKRNIEFLFRGPDLQNKSIFGLRDEYRISYYDTNFDLHLGDRNYSLSPLTERYGYGRGVGLDLHPGPTGAGGFYFQSLWSTHNFEEVGGYIKHDLTPFLGLKGNVLYKTGTHGLFTNDVMQNIYSIESRAAWGRLATLNLEYGISDGDRLSSGAHYGYRGELVGDLSERIHYYLEKVYAGPEFYGRYNDSDTTYGSLTFPIYRKLRGTFSVNQYDSNLDVDPAKSSIANRETLYRPGLLYTFPFKTDVSLEYQNFRREDVLKPADYDSTEQSVRIGVGHAFRKISLQTYVEVGQMENFLPPGGTHGVERYSLFANFQPTSHQTYSLFSTIGSTRYTAQPENTHSYGAVAQWQVKDNLHLQVQYSRNRHDSTVARENDVAHATVAYTFPNRSVLALTGRGGYNSFEKKSEVGAFVSYTIPLSLPVAKKKAVGVLNGKVFDAEKTGQPLARVVLNVGDATAVTDSQGAFIFPSIAPGVYALTVRQTSIGLDRTTLQPMPLMVEVRKGMVATVNIGVVRAAQVSAGAVLCTKPSNGVAPRNHVNGAHAQNGVASTNATPKLAATQTQEETPFEAGLIELTNANETFRQVTDKQGRVSFEHLRPGKWTLKMYDNNLPANHLVEQPESTLELAPGDAKSVRFRIVPKDRRIQLIDQGVIK